MVAAFQTLMELPAAKASLIQFAFYGGYATMAIPAALFIRRYSYKKAILLGLALYAVGALLFIPAAERQSFTFFCFSLYILTFGLAFLETTASPFILSLGAKENATRRLNLSQAFNPMGSLAGMAVASMVVLPNLSQFHLPLAIDKPLAFHPVIPILQPGPITDKTAQTDIATEPVVGGNMQACVKTPKCREAEHAA